MDTNVSAGDFFYYFFLNILILIKIILCLGIKLNLLVAYEMLFSFVYGTHLGTNYLFTKINFCDLIDSTTALQSVAWAILNCCIFVENDIHQN